MTRVISFIDGFNLYHAIRRLGDNRLKWCDVVALSGAFLSKSEDLKSVRFYTSDPDYSPDDVKDRHKIYTDALVACGMEIIKGKFKLKARHLKIKFGASWQRTKQWEGYYRAPEEKQTDVNLAVDLLDLAYRDEFDKCLVVTADSDMIPAMMRVAENFSEKLVRILLPTEFRVKDYFREFAESTPNVQISHIRRHHIICHRLPDEVAAADGGVVLCPADYR